MNKLESVTEIYVKMYVTILASKSSPRKQMYINGRKIRGGGEQNVHDNEWKINEVKRNKSRQNVVFLLYSENRKMDRVKKQ
jgi:hypothetical protein